MMDDPNKKFNSSWLLANAGSGKTFQIIQKILFLLIRGVNPEKILCITFTNNAAFEMRSRLDIELGSLLMMKEDLLLEKVIDLNPDYSNFNNKKVLVSNVRKNLGKILEKRDEIKIQTVHSFCSYLLRKFSIEANINPDFKVIDEKKETEFVKKILNEIAENDKLFFFNFIDNVNYFDLIGLSKLIIQNKEKFLLPFDEKKFSKTFIINDRIINLDKELKYVFEGLPNGSLEKIIYAFESGGINDKKNSILLKQFDFSFPENSLNILENVFLNNGFPKNENFFPSKKVKTHFPNSINLINKIKNKTFVLIKKVKEKNLFYKTKNLYKFSKEFINLYNILLKKENFLDYNDLIFNVLNLLKKDSQDWIKFNLDESIDHIIIDEAQDTSPIQWKIISEISNEFFNDERIHLGEKTLNVVGDEKQSIYSFQGTRPEVFAEMKNFYEEKFRFLGLNFHLDSLTKSYRSSPLILDFINEIFFGKKGFNGIKLEKKHFPYYKNMPGRVDIISLKKPKREISKISWTNFSDDGLKGKKIVNKNSFPNMIGKKIKKILDNDLIYFEDKKNKRKNYRKIEPKDILVLLRKRGKFFEDIIKEIKNLDIPVSDSDKFLLFEEISIKDLISVLKFLNDLDDDLSLAEALKSPILEMNEKDLFKVSIDRKGSLYKSLIRRLPKHPSVKILKNLVKESENSLPFEIIQKILVNYRGREKLIKKLGQNVSDYLDEFLDQIIIYEETELPSLRGFLLWINDFDFYIKKDLNVINNQVRIMTIHGAKGLESPIVILPDFFSEKNLSVSDILINFDDFVIFNEKENRLLETTRLIKYKNKDLSSEEENRLFYVALTRVKSWLLIFGYENENIKKEDKSWFFFCKKASEKINIKKYSFKKNTNGNKISLKYNWP